MRDVLFARISCLPAAHSASTIDHRQVESCFLNSPNQYGPRVLTTAIDLDDGSAALDLARGVAAYFELDHREAQAIANAWPTTARFGGPPAGYDGRSPAAPAGAEEPRRCRDAADAEPRNRPPPKPAARLAIEVVNAKTHNLKGIDCRVPHRRVTVVTGPSGAGKSSLAFDTIFAEGQRRFVESMSTYARQFLDQMERPPVDDIRNVLPAVALEAKNSIKNARSTVGTITETHDVLRLLFTHLGESSLPARPRRRRAPGRRTRRAGRWPAAPPASASPWWRGWRGRRARRPAPTTPWAS